MSEVKQAELLVMVDTVLVPQLLAVKATLGYLERELDGRSYAFDDQAKGGVNRLLDVFTAGGWVRRSIEQGGDGYE
jgi:hypothetical protein